MCKRAIGRKAMIVGGKVPKRCPFDTYGQKYLVCGRDDVESSWIKDKAMCLKKHSPKGVAFIDTGYHFDGMLRRLRVLSAYRKGRFLSI